MLTVIEVLGQLLACLLIAILAVGLLGTYIYIRTLDGLLNGTGWMARLFNRR